MVIGKTLLIIGAYIGSFTVTAYQSRPEFTDSTPFHTSINTVVNYTTVAASRDLLCSRAKIFVGEKKWILCNRSVLCPDKTKLHYFDVIFIEGAGIRVVSDTMNKRHKQWMDLWVPSHHEESKIWNQNKFKRFNVYMIKEKHK